MVYLPLIGIAEFKRRYPQLVANAQLMQNWASLYFVLGELNTLLSEITQPGVFTYGIGTVVDAKWFIDQGFYVVERDGAFFIVIA